MVHSTSPGKYLAKNLPGFLLPQVLPGEASKGHVSCSSVAQSKHNCFIALQVLGVWLPRDLEEFMKDRNQSLRFSGSVPTRSAQGLTYVSLEWPDTSGAPLINALRVLLSKWSVTFLEICNTNWPRGQGLSSWIKCEFVVMNASLTTSGLTRFLFTRACACQTQFSR